MKWRMLLRRVSSLVFHFFGESRKRGTGRQLHCNTLDVISAGKKRFRKEMSSACK
jgi:hypothetical protein